MQAAKDGRGTGDASGVSGEGSAWVEAPIAPPEVRSALIDRVRRQRPETLADIVRAAGLEPECTAMPAGAPALPVGGHLLCAPDASRACVLLAIAASLLVESGQPFSVADAALLGADLGGLIPALKNAERSDLTRAG